MYIYDHMHAQVPVPTAGHNLLDNLERTHIRHTGNSQHETDYLIKLVLQMGLALSTIFRADFNRFSNESCAPTNWLINI